MCAAWVNACAAIVPCWNESLAIAGVVSDLRLRLATVYVIDDGSQDATGDLARAAGARVLPHRCNLGKGAAVRTGLREASRAGYEWVVLLDGDGQHSPADLPVFFERAERSQADLLVGNRMHRAREMPWLRRLTNRWMSRALSRLAGMPLADSQCGYRLVRLRAWNSVSLRTSHFEVESEMLLAFARAGLRIEFVPVTVLGSGRPSRIRVVTDTWRWVHWRWSIRKLDIRRGRGGRCLPIESIS